MRRYSGFALAVVLIMSLTACRRPSIMTQQYRLYQTDLLTQLEQADNENRNGYLLTSDAALERVEASAVVSCGPVDLATPRAVFASNAPDSKEGQPRSAHTYREHFRPVSIDVLYGAAGRLRHYVDEQTDEFCRAKGDTTIEMTQVDVLVEPVMRDGSVPQNADQLVQIASIFPYKAKTVGGKNLMQNVSVSAVSPTGLPVSVSMPEFEMGGTKVRRSWLSEPNCAHWRLNRDKKSKWEIDGMWYATILTHVASPSESARIKALRVTLGVTATASQDMRRYVVRRVTQQILPLPRK